MKLYQAYYLAAFLIALLGILVIESMHGFFSYSLWVIAAGFFCRAESANSQSCIVWRSKRSGDNTH